MGRLTESMQGLRDAIKRQENQLSNYVKNGGFQEEKLYPHGDFSEESQKSYQTTNNQDEHFPGTRLCSAESEISQSSHWSCSLDTINSSIGDLKLALKNQDKQVIRLITENEELKNEMKKKEKELKKQKFLVKAERETFEQYKKDTFNEVKKHKGEESYEVKSNNKHFQETVKLKSELAHYRQLYVEQSHTVNRLSKLVSNLKGDKILLKEKLLQQEKRANKFILEMAKRFEVSRKEFDIVLSKKIGGQPVPSENIAVYQMVDRNSRLAYDNTMLKLELNMLKKTLLEKRMNENKVQNVIGRSVSYSNESNHLQFESHSQTKSETGLITTDLFKTMDKKSGIVNVLKQNFECEMKTSVTSFLNKNVMTWLPDVGSKSSTKISNVAHINSAAGSSEEVRLKKVCSAPQLTVSYESITIGTKQTGS